VQVNARRSPHPILLTTLLGLSGAALAGTYGATTGTVSFDYRVTVFPVHGSSGDVRADATFEPDMLGAARATVTVPLAALKTGNGLQEEHMRGALGTDRYPNAVFTLGTINTDTTLTPGQTLVTTATGTLSVRGVTRNVTVPLKLTLQGGAVNVATQFKFNPHDYGVDYFGGADSISILASFALIPKP